ncbi:MAG: organic hydroperoxide resistance protein [Tahibacter sp.]
MQILYRTSATAQGGRAGHVRSVDGVLDLDLAMPRELGGDGRAATNPEQLFAAGYSACFENALLHVARAKKLPVHDTKVSAEVGIGPRADGGFALAVSLNIELAGVDQASAEALVQAAHQVCPYSHALRGNVDVALSVTAI